MEHPKTVVDEETALNEFEAFATLNELDLAESDMSDADKKDFSELKRIFVSSVMRGRLTVDSNTGDLTFTPSKPPSIDNPPESVTFSEPEGESFAVMDKKKENHVHAKMYAVMAKMCGLPNGSYFAKMKQRDLKVCQAIMTLFLG